MNLIQQDNLGTNHAVNYMAFSSQVYLTLADKSTSKDSLITINNYDKNVVCSIDFRVIEDLCNNFNAFTKSFKNKSINIKLPNETVATADIAGTTKDLRFDYIFYLPKFSFNLIIISRLCNQLNYYAIFNTNGFYIKDLRTEKKISITNLVEGLYYFKGSKSDL